MRTFIPLLALALAACESGNNNTDIAASRQADATRTSMDAADRETGMPRIKNFAQRKLLKNAYEDMDQTTLTWAYSQGLDGRFVCMGQALGYGVSLGTQFTAPTWPQHVVMPDGFPDVTSVLAQPEPNGLYAPSSGEATIVDLIDPSTGEAHTAMVEPRLVTVPFKLPASVVSVPCPVSVDPGKVRDAKETSVVGYH